MREMSDGMGAAVEATIGRPIFFVELDFLSGPVRMWTGKGPFSWDGKTWAGVGDLLNLGEVEEKNDGTSTSVTAVLKGVPSDLTGAVYQDQWQGRMSWVWLGMFDETWTLIDDPVLLSARIMDSLDDKDDGTMAQFEMTATTPSLDQGDNSSWRLTHAIQNQFWPGDDIFQYTTVLQKTPIRWGATSTAPVVLARSILTNLL
jgi:hypothetical protein